MPTFRACLDRERMRRGLPTESKLTQRFHTSDELEEYLKTLPDKAIQYVPPPLVSDDDFLSGAWKIPASAKPKPKLK